MTKHHIRFGGKALGRPRKQAVENAAQLKQEKQQRRLDAPNRIPVEGKFGQREKGYGRNYIQVKTQKTSEAWINSIFLVMNLMVFLRSCRFFCIQLTGRLKMYPLRLIRSFFAELLPKVLNQFLNSNMILERNG